MIRFALGGAYEFNYLYLVVLPYVQCKYTLWALDWVKSSLVSRTQAPKSCFNGIYDLGVTHQIIIVSRVRSYVHNAHTTRRSQD